MLENVRLQSLPVCLISNPHVIRHILVAMSLKILLSASAAQTAYKLRKYTLV